MKKKPSIKPPHRYPSGNIVRQERAHRDETPEEAMSIARWQREKLGATGDNFQDQSWIDDPLMMLRRWAVMANDDAQGISDQQFTALKHYVAGRIRSLRSQGYSPAFPSCVMRDVSFGMAMSYDDCDDGRIQELKASHNSARSALLDYGQPGVIWLRAVDNLSGCVNAGRDFQGWWGAQLGEIRCAANILARHYGLTRA